ncbi:unnamed protein product [Blepharisma stoltei]|uniref:Ubiquitin-like domain-containing protein n=1 Tax=Blepharisma stoltei TaxID=1481888 RepID=A0AAU9JXJ8_9CILI|nr:unnamed protein product [Blepharisma stoltei]
MDVGSDRIRIKICTLDSQQFVVNAARQTPISELKTLILNQTQVPVDKQRLIFQGKVLKNQDNLFLLNVENDSIFYLVANLNPSNPDGDRNTLTDFLRAALANNQAASFITRRRQQRRREISANERLETIRQNIQTIEGLVQCMNTTINDGELQGFNFSERTLVQGQWVDVKDTVEQWLEAQVIQIEHRPEGQMAFIHYNGWPNRWDEWISISSPRIQPLRTYTLQSLNSSMQSPVLISPSDSPNSQVLDFNDLIMPAVGLLDQSRAMLERYYSLNTILQHEHADERVRPMRERLNMMHVEEEKEWSHDSHGSDSEATAGSGIEDNLTMELERSFNERNSELTTSQELGLLTIQISPLLDRIGRVITDLAVNIANNGRNIDDNASRISSGTGRSGSTNGRQNLQIPILNYQNDGIPRMNPEIDIHIHAIFAEGFGEQPEPRQSRSNCMGNIF